LRNAWISKFTLDSLAILAAAHIHTN